MNIEKLNNEITDFKELKDDKVLDLVKNCFESKSWIRTGDVFVLYNGKESLPDAVQVFTIKKVRTYVDRDSETWNDNRINIIRRPMLKEKILKVIQAVTEE